MHVSMIFVTLLDWVELDRLKGKHRLGCGFPRAHSAFMVMPYLSLGNLEDLHSESPIAVEETIDLLFQTLNVLKYLHPRGVAHRHLKPENILVESRSPLSVKAC